MQKYILGVRSHITLWWKMNHEQDVVTDVKNTCRHSGTGPLQLAMSSLSMSSLTGLIPFSLSVR